MEGAGPCLVMAHILSWLRQPRAPEPGWNQESSLQAPGLRHECPCPGQAPALPLQVKTLLRPGAARAGDRLPQAAGQNGPRPSSAPKSSLQAWSTGLSCGETGGPGALQPQCQPFTQPLQEGAVARLVACAGLVGNKEQLSLLGTSTPFISTKHHQPSSLKA